MYLSLRPSRNSSPATVGDEHVTKVEDDSVLDKDNNNDHDNHDDHDTHSVDEFETDEIESQLQTSTAGYQDQKRLLCWQIVVVLTCFLAYVMIYFCRDHIYVTEDAFKRDYLYPDNDDRAQYYLGIMLSIGYVGYGCGKLLFSLIADKIIKSGVKILIICAVGSAFFSFLFAMLPTIDNIFDNNDQSGKITISMILFTLIRFTSSFGWFGIIKIIGYWIPYSAHGRIMSFVSLSYLIGDTFVRVILGIILGFGFGWRDIFLFCAFITCSTVVPVFLLIKDKPSQRGLPNAEENPNNIYNNTHENNNNNNNNNSVDLELHQLKDEQLCNMNESQQENIVKTEDSEYENVNHDCKTSNTSDSVSNMTNETKKNKKIEENVDSIDRINSSNVVNIDTSNNSESKKTSLKSMIIPLITNPLYVCCLLLKFELASIRELFNSYSALYLVEKLHASSSNASLISALFPFMGLFSVVLSGIWVDKYVNRQDKRIIIFPIAGIFVTIGLAIFATIDDDELSLSMAIIVFIIVGLSILGPYSLLAGTISMEMGGHKAPAMACGIMDVVGILGAILFAICSSFMSFKAIFSIAALIGCCCIVTGLVLYLLMRRRHVNLSI